MDIGYYPGCALHGSSDDYEASVRVCMKALGVELNELEDWICCGATAAHCINKKLSTALPARNLGIAEKQNLKSLFAPCPMCSMELYQGECNPNPAYALHPGRFDYKYPAAGEKNSVVSVMLYDIHDGKLSKIELPLKDDDYIPDIRFSKEQSSQLMVVKLNRAQNHMNIYAVDPATGNSTEVYDEVSDMWIESDVVTGVKYYNTFFVVQSNRDGHMHIYKYDYQGKLIKQISSGDYEVTRYYGYDEAKRLFYFQSTREGREGALDRTIRCASDVNGEVQVLTPGRGTYSATFNSDFTYYIRRFSDTGTPPQYAIYQADGKLVRNLQLNEEVHCPRGA